MDVDGGAPSSIMEVEAAVNEFSSSPHPNLEDVCSSFIADEENSVEALPTSSNLETVTRCSMGDVEAVVEEVPSSSSSSKIFAEVTPYSIADVDAVMRKTPYDPTLDFTKPPGYCNEIGLSPSKAHVEFRIHPWRLLVAAVVLSTLLVVMTFALQQGFNLGTLEVGQSLSWRLLRNASISDQIDDLNSYSGNAASALGGAWSFALQLIVYVLVLAITPSLMFDNSTMWAKLFLLAITGSVGWLATQGFVATNVQLKPMKTIPFLSFADLNGFDANLMNNYQNYTPYFGNATQPSTSTILRSAIAGTYPRETATCSVFDEGDHTASVLFGFSNHEWLQYMLPDGSSDPAQLNLAMNVSWSSAEALLPMSQKNATALAILSLELTDTFFAGQKSDNVTRYESLLSGYGDQAADNTNGLLDSFQDLIGSTFSNEKKHFKHFSMNESTVQFTKLNLSHTITFDAITLEIPLKRNFFSCRLTTNITSNSSDGGSSTLTYKSTMVDVKDGEDAIYEMAVWDDCNTYGCMLSGLAEVNAKEVVTSPESQVLAVRICLDANGSEDILATISNCQHGRSNTSFIVFSIASRVQGDAMNIDARAGKNSRFRELRNEIHELLADNPQTGIPSGESFGESSTSVSVKAPSITSSVSSGSTYFNNGSEKLQTSLVSSDSVSGSMSDSEETQTPIDDIMPSTVEGSGFDTGAAPPNEVPGGDPTTMMPIPDLPLGWDIPVEIPGGDPTPSVQSDPISEQPADDIPVEIVPVGSYSPTVLGFPVQTSPTTTGLSQSTPQSGSDSFSPIVGAVSSSDQRNVPILTKTSTFKISINASANRASEFRRKAYIKNARKIYTITVGILSWKVEDLAQRFGATCVTTHNKDCQGLTFNLTKISKQLVVGQQYLPTANLKDFTGSSYLWTALARIKHDNKFGGDFASSKSFRQTNWPAILNGTDCKSSREEYLMSTLDNHLYSQHSLQPAYTAPLMWLFQHGTAHEIIDLGETKKSLAFTNNVIQNRVLMSTPSKSSYFTYGACALIVIFSTAVSIKAYRQNGVRPDIPVLVRTVAEVMMNANQYPPAFLTCYVHSEAQDSSGTEHGSSSLFNIPTAEPKSLQDFEIRGLQLVNINSSHHQWFSDGVDEKV